MRNLFFLNFPSHTQWVPVAEVESEKGLVEDQIANFGTRVERNRHLRRELIKISAVC